MPTTQSRKNNSRKPLSKPQAKSKVAAPARVTNPLASSPLIEARNSTIHGKGVYAVLPIKKGTRLLEYLGDRISHAEADRRYAKKADDDGHTFLFIASNRTVIDAGTNGNDARFINHHCNPNCETVTENARVYIDAIRNIKPGEELGYDYQLTWESTDEPEEIALYACRCGAKNCRGTMLDREPLDKKPPEKKAATKKSARKAAKRPAEKTARKPAKKPAKKPARKK